MKNFIWLLVGIAVGSVVTHEVNKTKQGKQFFSDLDNKAREFGEAISDGYRQREAELRAALGEAEAIVDKLSSTSTSTPTSTSSSTSSSTPTSTS